MFDEIRNHHIMELKLEVDLIIEQLLQLNKSCSQNDYFYKSLLLLLNLCYPYPNIIIKWLNDNNNKMNNILLKIDENIIIKWFEYLNIKDIINIGYINKYFQKLSQHNNISYYRSYKEFKPYLRYYVFKPQETNNFRYPFINDIKIEYFMIKCLPFLKQLKQISFGRFTYEEEERYSNVTDQINEILIKFEPQLFLTHLECYLINNDTIYNYLSFISIKCNYKILEQITLTQFEINKETIKIFDYFPNIKELSIDVVKIIHLGEESLLSLLLLFENKLSNCLRLTTITIENFDEDLDLLLLYLTKIKITNMKLLYHFMIDCFEIINKESKQLINIKFLQNIQNLEIQMFNSNTSHSQYHDFFQYIEDYHFNQIIFNYDREVIFEIILLLLSKIKKNGKLILNYPHEIHLHHSYLLYNFYENDKNNHNIINNKSNIQFCGCNKIDWKQIIINNKHNYKKIIGDTIMDNFKSLIFLFIYCQSITLTLTSILDIDIDKSHIHQLWHYIDTNLFYLFNGFNNYKFKIEKSNHNNNDILFVCENKR